VHGGQAVAIVQVLEFAHQPGEGVILVELARPVQGFVSGIDQW
jgi:hypothetical protein